MESAPSVPEEEEAVEEAEEAEAEKAVEAEEEMREQEEETALVLLKGGAKAVDPPKVEAAALAPLLALAARRRGAVTTLPRLPIRPLLRPLANECCVEVEEVVISVGSSSPRSFIVSTSRDGVDAAASVAAAAASVFLPMTLLSCAISAKQPCSSGASRAAAVAC